MLLGELAVVVQDELTQELRFGIEFAAQVARRAVVVDLLSVGVGQGIVGVLIVFLAVYLVVVHAIVVADQRLGLQTLERTDVFAEVEVQVGRRLEGLLAIFAVTADVGRHHGHGVLFQVEAFVVQHCVVGVGVSGIEHALLPQVADDVHGAVVGGVALVGHAGQVGVELQTAHYLCGDVGAYVELVVVQVAALEDTLLVEVTEAGVELHALVAARDAYVMLGLGRCLGDDQVVPVGGAACAVGQSREVSLAEADGTAVDVVPFLLVVDGHRVVRAGQFGHLVGNLDGVGTAVGYVDLALGAFLGGDQEHTVCGAYTVDGCGCVLQHGYVLDVVGVESLEILDRAWNSVDDHEGSAHATDIHVVLVCTGFGAFLPYTQTGNTAGKHVLRVLVVGLKHLGALDACHGTGYGSAALCAVTHHHQLVHHLAVGSHGDVKGGAAVQLLVDGRVTHVGEQQRGVVGSLDGVFAVHVG